MLFQAVKLSSCLTEMSFRVGELAFCRVEMVIRVGWMAFEGGETPIQVVGTSIQPIPMAMKSADFADGRRFILQRAEATANHANHAKARKGFFFRVFHVFRGSPNSPNFICGHLRNLRLKHPNIWASARRHSHRLCQAAGGKFFCTFFQKITAAEDK
jgi:hypothetical protein